MAAHALDLQTLLAQALALPAQPRIVACCCASWCPSSPACAG